MPESRLSATVGPDCKLVPSEPTVWAAVLSSFRGKSVHVTISTPRTVRSAQANRYWWGCVVPLFQEVWSLARHKMNLPSYTRDETHDVLVQVLVGSEDGPLPGTRVRKRTSLMDSAEFARLVDGARALAREQYGVEIPAPGESWGD